MAIANEWKPLRAEQAHSIVWGNLSINEQSSPEGCFFCHCLTLSSHFKPVLISHSQVLVVHDKSHTASHSKQKHAISITLALGRGRRQLLTMSQKPPSVRPSRRHICFKCQKDICMQFQSAVIVEGDAQSVIASRACVALMRWMLYSLLIFK